MIRDNNFKYRNCELYFIIKVAAIISCENDMFDFKAITLNILATKPNVDVMYLKIILPQTN